MILTAGVLLTLAATVGSLVGELVFAPGHGHWWLLLSAAFAISIGALGAFLQNALRLPPPGSFFRDWLLERRTRTERALTTVIAT